MRVFHVLPEEEPFSQYSGGALSRWAANVVLPDSEALILAPSADETWAFPKERVRTLPGLRPTTRWLRRLKTPWILQREMLSRLLMRGIGPVNRGDVLWIHNRPQFAAALAPLARRSGCRIVLHMQNVHSSYLTAEEARSLRVDEYVFCSDWLRRHAEQRQSFVNTSVIYNGADDSLFYPPAVRADHPEPRILFVGRVVPDKGVHILTDAMRLLQERGVSCKAVIIGASNFGGSADTKYIRSLRKTAPSNVEFAGYFSSHALAERFREADIFCTPATWEEPFGLVNVEAMATALPVVTTAAGGAPEIFSSGGGILIARNSVSELADALQRLVSDPRLRYSMGQQGFAAFKGRFTWQAIRRGYHDLLDGLRARSAEGELR